MDRAITKGREDAMRAVGKGRKSGTGRKNVMKGSVGVRNRERSTRGVRKAVNRNKGAKARKK
jgi:hypothetical protein